MKKSSPDFIKETLKPFRTEIDNLDDQILKLLGKRFDVVRKVAKVKIKHDIPAFLGDRVTQVRERAATNGLKYGIDPDFMRTLYTFIIYQSCAIEDLMKSSAKQKEKGVTGEPETAEEAPRVPDGGLPSRRAAYAILNDIIFQKKNLDEGFVRAPGLDALPARDKAFVRLLVSLVLKRAAEIDAVLAHLLHEPLADLKPPQLVNIFRLGVAQFIFLQTPAHAVVNTTVELAEAEGIAHHKPLVNAVMRRLTREGVTLPDVRDAGRMNTPAWLWTEWMNDYGVETALGIAAANFDEAPVDFSCKSNPEQWAETLGATLLPTGSLRKNTGGFIPDLPGFTQGAWWIQNAAAAIPAKLFGDLKGKTVVDLRAAPGGKTAQLAAAGAKVIAVDRSAERVKRLAENMQRLSFEVETVISDGAVWQPKEPVDAVLIDAPCTATGTIRHQPDVLWLKEPRDQEKLVALQKKLLLNAVRMLKPGGVLVYCTCSLQKAEGENQALWLLQQNLPLRISQIARDEIPGIADMVTARGELRCLPLHWKDTGGIDGFYVVRFERI